MKKLLPILLLSALLLTGCHNGDSSSAEETATESTTTAAVSDSTSKQTAKVTRLPVKEDLDYDIEEHLIVELYSK